MDGPPVIPYASAPTGRHPHITRLPDGGVDVLVPPQGDMWWTYGSWRPLIGASVILAGMAAFDLVMFLYMILNGASAAYVLPFVAFQLTVVWFVFAHYHKTGRAQARLHATREGLWIWTFNPLVSSQEQFFPAAAVLDVEPRWDQTRSGIMGGLYVTIAERDFPELLLETCQRTDVINVALLVRRALGMRDRTFPAPPRGI